MVEAKPAKSSASQRFVLLGLAGLVIVALASGIAWFTAHSASPTSGIQASPTSGIQASPTSGIPVTPALSITEFSPPSTYGSPDLGGIIAGPDGNLWFGSGNKVGRISPNGTITEFPLPSTNGSLVGITIGPHGNLLVYRVR